MKKLVLEELNNSKELNYRWENYQKTLTLEKIEKYCHKILRNNISNDANVNAHTILSMKNYEKYNEKYK